MGQPTFDLCYSEDEPSGAQAARLFDVFRAQFVGRWLKANRASGLLGANAIGRPMDARLNRRATAELKRGAPNRLRVGTKQKHLFGLTEITKKVFVPEYIGYKS